MRDLLITVPHASGSVPDDVLDEMLGDDGADADRRSALLHHLWSEGDPHTDALFRLDGATLIDARVSRFVVDVNRGRSEAGPNGVVKATDFQGRPLYPAGSEPGPERIRARLRNHYDPFHHRVEAALARRRPLLLLDGHSMTPLGPALGPDGGTPRPAASLITGGDEEGEPTNGPVSLPGYAARALATALRKALTPVTALHPEMEPEVTLNRPFAHGEIQRRYGDPAHPAAAPAVSVELNRALFETEGAALVEDRLPPLRTALAAALEEVRPVLERASRERRSGRASSAPQRPPAG